MSTADVLGFPGPLLEMFQDSQARRAIYLAFPSIGRAWAHPSIDTSERDSGGGVPAQFATYPTYPPLCIILLEINNFSDLSQ